jgi:deoxyribodipyrimidine photolyase-related protein
MTFIIFPTQLFNNIDYLNKNEIIYLIEEPIYFTDFKYHKLKLAFHRASMKKYYDMLKNKNYKIKYINFNKVTNDFYLSLTNVKYIDPIDNKLKDKLKKLLKKSTMYETNSFLVKLDDLENIKKTIYKNNKYSHTLFYKYQRIKLNILLKNNKPIGDKWSYDNENRNAIPNDYKLKENIIINLCKYKKEAIIYVNKHFNKNYGSLDNFFYPIDNISTLKWFDNFLKNKLKDFGKYQDAILEHNTFIYHSILSPMLNIGLITDTDVVNISYKYYLEHKNIPIQSFEGFIRQVIGWRNYIYIIYLLEGKTMIKSNYLKHNNKINDNFWLGTTNIKPIDDSINKIIKYSYVHHIERLMLLGNFMLLCLIHPDEVYRIFMEWTIDAYDWVMVPNIYGMSQYATNNLIMTRPYFSSSNYILKMSDYKKDKWCDIWNALYYNFINEHQIILKKSYAYAQQVKYWNIKSNKEKNIIINIANNYINDKLN